ncbi:MAG: GH92 family glycosyl hydrolase [Bacteroidota bacterium]
MRVFAFVFFLFCILSCQPESPQTAEPIDQASPVDLVEPLIDAANSRWFFFSSACRPFGMVNLSPDNLVGGTWGTGYRYDVDTIRSFSHVHAWQLSGISTMPIGRSWHPDQGTDAYASPFSHKREIAKPGYHSVWLEEDGIHAELTSTVRVGMHRYTYPEGKDNKILFNLSGGQLGPAMMTDGKVSLVSETEIEGYTVNGSTVRRPKETPVFFVARFNRPITQMDGWEGSEFKTDIKSVLGSVCGAVLEFHAMPEVPLLMKVGISYVSEEQARKNLEMELAHWDFERIREESRADWNNMLSKIEVNGGSKEQKVRFYTDLWHALQGRRIISDADGSYSDFTGPKRLKKQIPLDSSGKPQFNHYNSDSFWGAQWTLNTLWHLVYPKISEEFCQSMLMMYRDGGLIPRGPSGGNYTYVMTGASSTPFFVSAYTKGIRGFDIEEAYEGLKKNHLPGGIMSKVGYEHNTEKGGGIEAYIEKGFIPYPLYEEKYGFHQDGAGQTLENAYQDWTLAQMAKGLGKEEDYAMFTERAGSYRNLYDPQSGWMRPKDHDGNWLEPFNPLKYDDGWVEATAASFTWFVPHDVQGLVELMGGADSFANKLNFCFEQADDHGFVNPDKQHRDNYLNYGNQPSMQTGYLFNYVGKPWLTQYWIRRVIEDVYSGVDPHSGYSGDEDQGLMGALSVLMKMGIFSMKGGTSLDPIYELSGPIFDRVVIHLDPNYYAGGSFEIQANNDPASNPYIQSAILDGQSLDTPWFYHRLLVDGGKLELEMGPQPNEGWGSEEQNAPPSMR